jgi:predicted  nucleic acid-binding Zn-ribbon protein
MKLKDGVITGGGTTRRRASEIGAHAFAVVGYTREGLVVQNSWGQSWGGVRLQNRKYSGLALWPYDDATGHLLEAWVLQLGRRPFRPPLVGYDADSLEGDDLLEIRAEVNAFSYVLASRAIKPPLALGLFGDWGSGKSFFMQEMQTKIAALAGTQLANAVPDSKPVFCSHIVQIRFNAWHYLDTDLWASLVTEIFDKLFESIGGKLGKPEEDLPKLAAELQAANGVYQQAKHQLDDAETARVAAEKKLTAAIDEREKREGALLTQLDDIATLVAGNAELKASVDKLAKDFGLPELQSSYAALDARATEVKTLRLRFAALLQAMFSTPWGWARLLTLLAAVCAPVLVVVGIELLRVRWPQAVDNFHSFALQVSALIGAITAWLGAQFKRGAGVLATLEDTHRKLDVIRTARRTKAVAKEQSALQALKEKEDAARKNLQEAEQRVQALQREVAELQPGRLIMRFIEERSRSSDYRSRLGIVSLVRRDFERLSELADPDSDKRNPELMPVERIILYIDDLDRCRPERVIEVLEAVHLLLAFKLFMVVVAVDPRWLRRCLEEHYPDLLALRTQEVTTVARVVPSRPATAQDYLEKIFQIPFTLQPLKDDGYRRLVRGLTALNLVPDVATPVAGRNSQPRAVQGSEPVKTGSPAPVAAKPTPAVRSKGKDEEEGGDEGAIERLNIRSWELQDMEHLARVFRTPRAVKRFINTYRFLRAGVRPHELVLFEGDRDAPGTYRAALVLLAVVVSYSNVAPRFLRRIIDTITNGGAEQSWIEFLRSARADAGNLAPKSAKAVPATPRKGTRKSSSAEDAKPRAPQNWDEVEWQQLLEALSIVSSEEFPVHTVGELTQWIRIVARYSFSLAAVATLDR